jgi:adenylosuccinate synthase
VDGQFGSTGKGVFAGMIAEEFGDEITVAMNNAGPNSGHTTYHNGNKYVLKQLPTCGVIAKAIGYSPKTWLNAGAIVNPDILRDECAAFNIVPNVDPSAAIIDEDSVQMDVYTVQTLAGTGQGVGPALARKVMRMPNAIVGQQPHLLSFANIGKQLSAWHEETTFLEVSQGFSLGINQGFYPNCTSRECTVSQALADAGYPPRAVRGVAMAVRTYPIRVGNTENSSGPCYPDQRELTWEEIGQEPELTTVTKRVRRVFSWSRQQFREAVMANHPDTIFLNFVNYLPVGRLDELIDWVRDDYQDVTGERPLIILGRGPKSTDMEVA